MRMLLFVLSVSLLLGSCSCTTAPSQERIIFYGVLDSTIYTYQKFYIVDNQIALNYLDMEPYGYYISSINRQGDSIIDMSFDKEIDLLQYGMGNIMQYTNVAPNATKRLMLKRNGHSHSWQMLINGELYKYLVVDSLDLYKSGFAVDTINHWLDDVE